MIIVEGSEFSGATQLSKVIAMRLGYNLVQTEPCPISRTPLEHYSQQFHPRTVYRSFHMRDLVEDNKQMKECFYFALDRMILKRAGIIIVCSATDEVIAARHAETESLVMLGSEQIKNKAYRQIGQERSFGLYLPFVTIHMEALELTSSYTDNLLDMIATLQGSMQNMWSYLRTTDDICIR